MSPGTYGGIFVKNFVLGFMVCLLWLIVLLGCYYVAWHVSFFFLFYVYIFFCACLHEFIFFDLFLVLLKKKLILSLKTNQVENKLDFKQKFEVDFN